MTLKEGNDHEFYQDERTIGHTVVNPEDMMTAEGVTWIVDEDWLEKGQDGHGRFRGLKRCKRGVLHFWYSLRD